jgi:hypothetical protein
MRVVMLAPVTRRLSGYGALAALQVLDADEKDGARWVTSGLAREATRSPVTVCLDEKEAWRKGRCL